MLPSSDMYGWFCLFAHEPKHEIKRGNPTLSTGPWGLGPHARWTDGTFYISCYCVIYMFIVWFVGVLSPRMIPLLFRVLNTKSWSTEVCRRANFLCCRRTLNAIFIVTIATTIQIPRTPDLSESVRNGFTKRQTFIVHLWLR